MAWRVNEGERVALGDILAEIETDKAVTELESTASGVVLKLLMPADALVQTGELLAYIGEPGETLPEEQTAGELPAAPAPLPEEAVTTPTAERHFVPVAPVVRNLARELGVELAAVRGSGHGGVITREDVQRAQHAAPAAAAEEYLTRKQAAVARAVTQSWQEIPHIYFSAVVDMTAARRLRANAEAAGGKVSFDAIFLKALAAAINSFPIFSARLDGERIVRTAGICLAVAISVENDLYLPVISDVERKALAVVQRELADSPRRRAPARCARNN